MKFNLNLDNINYIKIVYKDRDENTCCTKAAIKNMSEREIFACAKFEEGLNIQTPQEISLSFVCENGLYRTNTTLKYLEKDAPYIFFGIKTPLGLEYQQNREYFRVVFVLYKPLSQTKLKEISCGVWIFNPSSNFAQAKISLSLMFLIAAFVQQVFSSLSL